MSASRAVGQGQTAPGLAHRLPDGGIPLLECTLGDLLRRSAGRYPDRRAMVWTEGEGLAALTRSQFLEEAERVARVSYRLGLATLLVVRELVSMKASARPFCGDDKSGSTMRSLPRIPARLISDRRSLASPNTGGGM